MSNSKYIFKHAAILFLIAFVCSLMLVLCNHLTKDKIAYLSEKTEAEAKAEVLPSAEKFEDAPSEELKKINDPTVSAVFKGLGQDGKVTGYCVKAEPSGFGGKISMIVGVDAKGSVCGVKITSMSETPGLGAKADDTWLKQYKGKSGDIAVIKNGSPKENEINAISGATITSKAVTSGVNSALKAVKAIEKEGK